MRNHPVLWVILALWCVTKAEDKKRYERSKETSSNSLNELLDTTEKSLGSLVEVDGGEFLTTATPYIWLTGS